MVRPNELCGLRVGDVRFLPATRDGPAGLQLELHGVERVGTKGNKRRGERGGHAYEHAYVRQRDDELDVVRPLQQLLSFYRVGAADADRPLLRLPLAGGALTNAAVTATRA